MADLRISEYLDRQSRSPFAIWFEGLTAPAAAKVTAALYQLASGNWAAVASLNERSILARAIGSISAKTETRS